MINVSEELKTIYKNDLFPYATEIADKDLTIYFPAVDLTVLTDQVKDDSFELTEMLFSEKRIVFGSCIASKIKFTVADVSEDLTGLEFSIMQTVNGLYEIPLGTYVVASCKKQDDLRFKDIVAYDRMKKIDVDVAAWYNSQPFPMTLASFRSSLLSYLGLEEEPRSLPNDIMTVEKTIEATQLSGRAVLEACEEINGCFGHINRYGKFSHIVLEPNYGLYPSVTLYPSSTVYPVSESDTSYVQPDLISETVSKAMYEKVKFEEYTVKEIDKLIVRSEEDDIGAIVGTGSNAYIIEGNFLVFGKSADELSLIARNAWGNMMKRPYRPYNTDCIGLPYVEVGDTIGFATDDFVSGYVFERTLTGIQALRDNFVAQGGEQLEQNFGLNKEIIKLQGKTAVIKKTVDEVSVSVSDLAADTESKFTQTSQQISAEVSRATQAEGNLNAAIQINADQIQLRVEKNGVVSAINQSSEEIKISASKITLEGVVTANNYFKILADGSMEAVNGKFSGTLNTPIINGGEINGAIITSTSGDLVTRISGGGLYSSFGEFEAVSASMLISVGSQITLTASSGDVHCTSINGYAPITAGNIANQYVYGASYADNAVNAGYANNANRASFANSAESLKGVVYVSVESNLRPYDGYYSSCGTVNGKWTSVWANNGTIQTSDERKKTDIKPLKEDERFLKFAKMIVPYTYKMIDGTSGRYHIGFIAQRIEEAMNVCGISSMEFAGLIKAPIYAKMLLDEDGNETDEYDTSSEIIDYDYNLRYDEFIPLIFLWLGSLKFD